MNQPRGVTVLVVVVVVDVVVVVVVVVVVAYVAQPPPAVAVAVAVVSPRSALIEPMQRPVSKNGTYFTTYAPGRGD